MKNKIGTELRNTNTINIDQLDGVGIAKLINSEDKMVAEAVDKVTNRIGEAIEKAYSKFKSGGRLIYMGAGTSGRLGALDAIELTPTYGVPNDRAFGLLAGGERAMYEAVEGAEDSKELAIEDLKNVNLSEKDIVIAIAASGRTPYAISGIEYANEVGALSISVTCTESNEMIDKSQIAINPVTGPEVITGSTRMKAGTAQKMVLNMFSTGIMIKMGYVYENLMVNVQPTNEKLVQRSISILSQILKIDNTMAENLLKQAHNNVSAGIVMHKLNLDYNTALKKLNENENSVNKVLN